MPIPKHTPTEAEVQAKAASAQHFKLLGKVEALYRERAEPAQRAAFYRAARQHLSEMPELLRAVQEVQRLQRLRLGVVEVANDDTFPFAVPTFRKLETVLCEDGQFDEALQVWDRALDSGYLAESDLQAQVDRIEKRRARASKRTA